MKVLAWVLAVILGVLATVFGFAWQGAENRVTVATTVYATGPCGDMQIKIIDDSRVAVAGKVVMHDMLSYYRLEGGQENLRVYEYRDNQWSLIMDRSAPAGKQPY